MDLTATTMCKENHLPIYVFNMDVYGNLKKVMEGEFNKNYFTAVDMLKLHDIPFDSKKAKLLTNHPEGTYELQKDNEGYLTLVITNPDSFWSLSRYLVVELN